MNKKTLTVVLIVIVAIGASLAYVLLRKETTTTQSKPIRSDSSQAEPKSEAQVPKAQSESAKGWYSDYSEEVFAATKGTKLLFFHASWCPQCRALDESITSSELPSGVTIFKVDYDSNQALRAKYGVTLQTTVVKVDEGGAKLASYVAYSEPTFQSIKQALLP